MPFNSSGLRSLGVNAVNPPDTWFTTVDPTENDYIMHDVGKFCYVTYNTTPATWSLWYLASKANMIAHWIRLYPESVTDTSSFITDGAGVVIPTGGGAVNIFGGALIDTTATPPAPLNTITISVKPGLNNQVIGGVNGGDARYKELSSPNIVFDFTNPARIVMIAPAAGGGDLRSEDLNISVATALGYINVYGAIGEDWNFALPDNNITTYRIDANTLGIGLTKTINQPLTNATATQGMYKLGNTDFLHAYGVESTWCGLGAGNLAFDIAQAKYNSAFGFISLASIGIGQSNTACGSGVLSQISNGSFNCGLGYLAGDNYLGPESSNIVIANPGVAADNNTIRIGVMGAGLGEQNKCVVAGVWNGTDDPTKNNGITVCDEDGMLYVADIPDNSIVSTNATGRCTGIKGDIGTVLTGHGLGALDLVPEFLPLESSGGSVTITTNPVTGAINLEAAGVAALTQLTTDTGAALPLLGNINVVGGELINTDNVVANTVTVNLDRSTLAPAAHCEIVTGMGPGAASIYKELYCSDGSILFDLATNPAKIDITAPGGGGGTLATLTDDAGTACIPVLANIQIDSGDNIETTTMGPGVIEVRVTDNVDLPFGYLHAQQEIRTTAGNLVSDAGTLRLPVTSATAGAVYLKSVAGVGGERYFHGFGGNNLFCGNRSGNTTMDVTSFANIGIGLAALEALGVGAQYNCATGFTSQSLNQSGSNNSSYGSGSLSKLTSGTYNSAFSFGSLNNLLTGSRNFAAGYNSGTALAGAESDNIYLQNIGVVGEGHVMRLGTNGAGNGQVSSCYVAGVYGAADGPNKRMVVCGDNGKFSTDVIPTAAANTFHTDAGNAVPTGAGVLNIVGGYNIDTRAAGSTVTIDLEDNINQGSGSIYSIGARGAFFAANRFMHERGLSCTYLGSSAGSIAGAMGTSCTGVGFTALRLVNGGSHLVAIGTNSQNKATTATNCITIGSGSGSAITSASADILIGRNAGLNYDTESYNIIVGGSGGSTAGDAGQPFDTRTMYLGYKQIIDPVTGAITTNGTNDTYIYGIYNRTISSTATPVYVDHLGKLGTAGACAFSFYLINSLYNQTGDGTLYRFGQTAGSISIEFDKTGSLTPGVLGAPIIFTAPYDGRYSFTATVTYIIPLVMPPPVNVIIDPFYLIVTNIDPLAPQKSKAFTAYLPNPTAVDQNVSEIVTAFLELDAGDTVQWACRSSGGTKQIGLLASLPASPGVPACRTTHFSGYRVS